MSIIEQRVGRVGISTQSANLLLLLVSMAWGLSYVLMKIGGSSLPPLEVLALRFTLASLVCALIFRRRFARLTRRILLYGLADGIVGFACSSAIIFGTRTTEASTASFLTSSAIVIVPVAQAIRKHRLPDRRSVFCTLLATLGIALLSLKGSLVLSPGAALCIIGAILYAAFIILTDELVRREDAILLGILQLMVMSVIGWGSTLLVNDPVMPRGPVQWGAILGLALVCSAFAFVAQPFAQRFASPEHTALILSMEPVWGAVFSFILLAEYLSLQAAIGALLVFASVIITSGFRFKRHRH